MKFALLLIVLMLAGTTYNQIDQFNDRHDGKAYFIAHNVPYPLVDFDSHTNTDSVREKPYKPKDTVTYKVDRTLDLPQPVMATVTRRIVRRFTYNGRPGREPIYSYPAQAGVQIDPGDTISFSHADLPSSSDAPSPMNPNPKDIPPGVYSLETAISFVYHGDQRTYTARTSDFRVEAR